MSSRAGRTARSPCTSCSRRTRAGTPTRPSPAIRHLLGVPAGDPLPAERISVVRLGTTVATNALLERKGEPTVLVITAGFADALRIAYQDRPKIFDRQIIRPELLYSRVIEADERIGAHGEVIRPLDEAAVERDLRAAYADGFRAVAVVLHARLPLSRARAADRRDRQADRLHPGVGVPRDQPADEAGLPRRHDGRGRLPVADHRPLRGPGLRRAGRRPGCSSCSPTAG